jgi:undecaprenyl-diphosphatase
MKSLKTSSLIGIFFECSARADGSRANVRLRTPAFSSARPCRFGHSPRPEVRGIRVATVADVNAVAPVWVERIRSSRLAAIMLVAALVLIGLTLVASESGPDAVDIQATLWLQEIKWLPFATLMYWVSWPGYMPQNLALPVVLAGLFLATGFRTESLWVLGTAISGVVTTILKNLVQRPRPSPDLVGVLAPVPDWSFPSGHTVQYTTLFGFAFLVVFVRMRRSALRTALLIVLALPIVLVGPSRLYLGQHWLSDVLGGYAVALLLLIPYGLLYSRVMLARRAPTDKP